MWSHDGHRDGNDFTGKHTGNPRIRRPRVLWSRIPRLFQEVQPYVAAGDRTIFLVFVMAIDFFLVALLINRSLDMFASLLGTWIPFALIFSATYLTGLYIQKTHHQTMN